MPVSGDRRRKHARVGTLGGKYSHDKSCKLHYDSVFVDRKKKKNVFHISFMLLSIICFNRHIWVMAFPKGRVLNKQNMKKQTFRIFMRSLVCDCQNCCCIQGVVGNHMVTREKDGPRIIKAKAI